MLDAQFYSKKHNNNLENGSVSWSSPSNIALVKYWGKKAHQIPENASLSFTLDVCKTTTKLIFEKRDNRDDMFSFDVVFEGEKKEDFKPKIEVFFKRIESYLPFLKDFHFTIETSNTFPVFRKYIKQALMRSFVCTIMVLSQEKSFF